MSEYGNDNYAATKKDTDEFAMVMVAFGAMPVVFLCIALIGWGIFSLFEPTCAETPSLGYCTLDGHIIRCNKDLGGEPHHYVHHEYEVLEITK